MNAEKQPTVDELKAEIERLKSELESSKASPLGAGAAAAQDEMASVTNDTNTTLVGEINRVVMGLNAANAELLRSGTEIVTKLNEEVAEKSKANQGDLAKTMIDLGPELYKGYLRALGRASAVPARMAREYANQQEA